MLILCCSTMLKSLDKCVVKEHDKVSFDILTTGFVTQSKAKAFHYLNLTLALGQRLLKHLSELFDAQKTIEETALIHEHLFATNIIVSNEGGFAAIPDWSCISALPLWRASHLDFREAASEAKSLRSSNTAQKISIGVIFKSSSEEFCRKSSCGRCTTLHRSARRTFATRGSGRILSLLWLLHLRL